MRVLYGAVDETYDGLYLAFVVGNEQAILDNIHTLPTNFTHMSSVRYTPDVKKSIVDNLNLKGTILAHCVKFGLPELNSKIEAIVSTKRSKIPQEKISRIISYRLVGKINSMYCNFAMRNGMHIQDIEFEADNEVIRRHLRDAGLKHAKTGNTHKIADCLAYANLRGWSVKGNFRENEEGYEESFHKLVISALK